MDLIWLFVLVPFVSLIFLPQVLFNIFSAPQILALSSLSALGMAIGMYNGIFPVGMPILFSAMFLMWMTASFAWTEPLHNGKKEYGQQAPMFLLFMLGCAYINTSNVHLVLLAFTAVALLECLYSFGQTKKIDWFFANSTKGGGPIDNAIGTIGNPNFLASYLTISFWLTIAAALLVSPYIFAISAFNLFMLYKTKSRAGLLGIVGSVFFGLVAASYFQMFPMYNTEIFMALIALFCAFCIFVAYMFIKHWDTFWNKPIADPNGPQIWYLTLRYRFCYWWAAWELIKEKPLFGWGMWSYRKEVYRAQGKIHNEKWDKFLQYDRYLTPQPRECHNDFIEYLVEYGLVGFGLFVGLLSSIVFLGFSFMATFTGLPFFIMLTLMCAFVSTIINAVFFFSLRLVPTSIAFWLTCAMIVGCSGFVSPVYIAGVPLLMKVLLGLFTLAITGVAVYQCAYKRFMASYWFYQSRCLPTMEKRSEALAKALYYQPNDTILRTHACLGSMDHDIILSNFHAIKMLEHFDGMVPLWSCLFNVAMARARTKNHYEESTMLLNNAFYVHPYWPPTRDMLFSPDGIGSRSRYVGGPRNMVVASELIKSQIGELQKVDENIKLKIQLIDRDIEKLRNKLKIAGSKTKKEILQLKIEILERDKQNLGLQTQICMDQMNLTVLQEKKNLNIPDNWLYHGDSNQFIDQAEAQKRGLLGDRLPVPGHENKEDPYGSYSLQKQAEQREKN